MTLIGHFGQGGLSNPSIYTHCPRLCVCVCACVARQQGNADVWVDGERLCSEKCEGDSDVGVWLFEQSTK